MQVTHHLDLKRVFETDNQWYGWVLVVDLWLGGGVEMGVSPNPKNEAELKCVRSRELLMFDILIKRVF